MGEPSPPSQEEIMNACRNANQNFIEAREAYSRYSKGEVEIYSDPAMSSLEELTTHELYGCETISNQKGPYEINERVYPLIRF